MHVQKLCSKDAAAELNEVQVETEQAKHVPSHDKVQPDMAEPISSLECLWSCSLLDVHEVYEYGCKVLYDQYRFFHISGNHKDQCYLPEDVSSSSTAF